MKVVHIIPGLDPAGGMTYVVLRLVDALAGQGVTGEVHTLWSASEDASARNDLVGYPASRIARRLGISPAMRRGLASVCADVFHNSGVWMMPNIYAGAAARERGIPLVFSPHGMFTEWAMAFSRRRKQVVWTCLGQHRAVKATACFHALAESEAEDIRRLGFRQPIAVVPSGVEIPSSTPKPSRDGRLRRVLFLSRIHPKKGVPLLLRAWARLEAAHTDWELVVAGPDELGHLAHVRALAGELGVRRVSFPGPAYGEAKGALYRSADLFVLPTHSENFAIVVAEALAYSLPVITTTGAPWADLRQRACGWWIPLSECELAEALGAAMKLPSGDLERLGRRGRLWAEEAFAWPRIAEEMKGVYEWVLAGGAPPSCVVTE